MPAPNLPAPFASIRTFAGVLALWSLAAFCLPQRALAQTDRPPEEGGRTFRLGMPPIWKGHAGTTFGWHRPGARDDLFVHFHAGLMKDLISPVAGAAALGVEGYVGYRGDRTADGGGRALFSIPALHFTTGVDYNIPDQNFSALLRLEIPFRRGGIFGRGSQVRLEWLPGRGQTFALGLNVPLWGRNIGETRPEHEAVKLEEPPIERGTPPPRPPGLDEALAHVREGAVWMTRLAMPFIDRGGAEPEEVFAGTVTELRQHIAATSPLFPAGRSLAEEQRVYHAEIERAFSLALGETGLAPGEAAPQGRLTADAARRILLEDVLFPYNFLLGQRKVNDGLDQFAATAKVAFSHWMLTQADLPEARFDALFYVFETLTDVAEEVRAFQKDRWEDSRLVWLPLQLALPADAYDTQAELNALIEQATRGRFTHGNRVSYVMNEAFQLEFARTVAAAEDYHVLWIHDYRGRNDQGQPDEISFRQTVNVYLGTMAERIRAYDETGKLPQYFIFLDQNYFEANDTRLWFRILRDPLGYSLDLPAGYEAWEQAFVQIQAELREAVAGSKLLQAQVRQYGEKWLRDRIQVHLNVTNPSDFSFTSLHVAGILPVPDNVMRDHRKIVFYDITEADPYRGMAMYTGMGVGEHYIGPNWEDRAVILRGPSALTTKTAARRLLEAQGFRPEEIPFPLRPEPKAATYETEVDSVYAVMRAAVPGDVGQVLELHNETGFAEKPINVEKAILFSLMPPGALLKIPDSLWLNYVYASLLTGSALRGCQVLIMAPARVSAPSAAAPTLARAHDLLSALVYFENALVQEAAAQGGLLRVGLYRPEAGVGDLAGRIRQARSLEDPWLREVYPENPAVAAVVDSVEYFLDRAGFQGTYLLDETDVEVSPKLHLKANFFISRAVWQKLWTLPQMGPVMREYLIYLAQQTGPLEQRPSALEAPEALRREARQLARDLQGELTAEEIETAFAYLTIGSTNMDYRSMVMDGEVQITLVGWTALPGLADFLLLSGLCEWIDTQEELDRLLPPPSGLVRSMANLIKLLL